MRYKSPAETSYQVVIHFVVGMVVLSALLPLVYVIGMSLTSQGELIERNYFVDRPARADVRGVPPTADLGDPLAGRRGVGVPHRWSGRCSTLVLTADRCLRAVPQGPPGSQRPAGVRRRHHPVPWWPDPVVPGHARPQPAQHGLVAGAADRRGRVRSAGDQDVHREYLRASWSSRPTSTGSARSSCWSASSSRSPPPRSPRSACSTSSCTGCPGSTRWSTSPTRTCTRSSWSCGTCSPPRRSTTRCRSR